jgi:5-methylcytosine-specific restriction endonuclease McrA
MAVNTSDPNVRLSVLSKYDFKCAYCGIELTKDTLQIDHLIPKSRRYSSECDKSWYKIINSIENLMPSCNSCNACKSNLDLEDFRDRLYDRVDRLNKYSSEYNIAKRFGLINEKPTIISFHFEKFING